MTPLEQQQILQLASLLKVPIPPGDPDAAARQVAQNRSVYGLLTPDLRAAVAQPAEGFTPMGEQLFGNIVRSKQPTTALPPEPGPALASEGAAIPETSATSVLGPFAQIMKNAGGDFSLTDLVPGLISNLDRAMELMDDPLNPGAGVSLLTGTLTFLDKLADNARADAKAGGSGGSPTAWATLALQQAEAEARFTGMWKGEPTLEARTLEQNRQDKLDQAGDVLKMDFLNSLTKYGGGFAAPGTGGYLGGWEPGGAWSQVSARQNQPFNPITAPELPLPADLASYIPRALQPPPMP